MAELPRHHAATQQRARDSAELVLRGIALNAMLAAMKFAGGFFGHTYALIADGAESLLDILSSVLVWAGFRVASRPPDANHPYGHGKAEPLAALAVAIFVFAAAVWIAWHAVHEILTPHRGPHWATLPLLAVIVAIKIWFSRRMRSASEKAGSTALGAEALHHYSDAVTSGAAFIGIAIAVWGGPKYAAADDWAALIACAVIAANGVVMTGRGLRDVMDTAVPEALENQVRSLSLQVTGVRSIDKCRVRKSGLSHLVDIHVRVDGDLTVRQGHRIAHAVQDALLASVLRVSDVSVHIEPVK
ncbi:MAG: cation diffusion facilitator family transporter [Opitutus sp.]